MTISIPEARALYDGGAPVAHIAKALNMKAGAFRRLRQKHGWPMRPSPIVVRTSAAAPKRSVRNRKVAPAAAIAPAGEEEAAPAEASLPPGALDLPAFRRQIADAAHSELSKVQKTLASGKTEDVERNARLLASLVKSLAELRRLEALDPPGGVTAPAVEGQDDEPPPRDLDALRDELARALERMSVEPGRPGAGG
jgi:hypothetical protein